MTGIPDEQLMQAVAHGDLDAFNKIVLRYQQQAWRTAYRLLDDVMEAEDVAQETFLKILKAAPRYRPSASFRTYLYTIISSVIWVYFAGANTCLPCSCLIAMIYV